MPRETILTFDIGTSACKVCLWDAKGMLLSSADEAYPIHQPEILDRATRLLQPRD
jgi:sugar (pentulose or hexulose) kinase